MDEYLKSDLYYFSSWELKSEVQFEGFQSLLFLENDMREVGAPPIQVPFYSNRKLVQNIFNNLKK